jgi:uncharacterized protein (DUF1499 family)
MDESNGCTDYPALYPIGGPLSTARPGAVPARTGRNPVGRGTILGNPAAKVFIVIATVLALGSAIQVRAGDKALGACPDTPNCVSSQAADVDHSVPALTYRDDPGTAWRRAVAAVTNLPRVTVVEHEGGYMHAEVRSLVFRFVDDVELLLDRDGARIDIRSASRTGRYDFGVNRRRVETIRDRFESQVSD